MTTAVPTMMPNDDWIAHHGILGMKWGIRRFQNKDGSLKAAGKKRYSSESEAPRDKGLAPGVNSGKGSSTLAKVGTAAGIAALAGGTAYAAAGQASKKYDASYKNMSDDELRKANIRSNLEANYKKTHNIGDPTKDMVDASKDAMSAVKKFRDADKVPNNPNQNRYNTRQTLTQKEMDAMSDQDLQKLVNRMNLETQYSRLTQDPPTKSKVDVGLERAEAVMAIVGSAVTIGAAGYGLYNTIQSKKSA